jgi:UDP-3-O-[3-hydroxymyristoyl] N-acetylglucosamine deacetylase
MANTQSEKWGIMIYQRTLESAICCTGTGLHSGREVSLTLEPAPPDTGIVFIRKDLPEAVDIRVEMKAVSASTFATTLENRGVSVGTVEHLLAALSGLAIDNVIVEMDAPEAPIMDGSAAPFVSLIREAGAVEQNQPRKYMVVRKAVRIVDNGSWMELSPSTDLKISCTVDFAHPLISKQFYEVSLPGKRFEEEISPARTFGFLSDVAELRSRGYALGGSLQNAIVMDDFGVLNEEGLRFPDEFVRHKILDLIGDFSLLGHPIICHVTAYKSGHAMTHKLLRELLSRQECWEMTELSDRRMQKVAEIAVPPPESRERASA